MSGPLITLGKRLIEDLIGSRRPLSRVEKKVKQSKDYGREWKSKIERRGTLVTRSYHPKIMGPQRSGFPGGPPITDCAHLSITASLSSTWGLQLEQFRISGVLLNTKYQG